MADLHLPPDFADLPVERATRLVALAFLQAAIAARERLADPKDHEALHDFRVAIRRLRYLLEPFAAAYGDPATGTGP